MENAPTPAATPAPAVPAAAAPAAPPVATAPPAAKPIDLAPEGNNCPHCNERMQVWAKYAKTVEYACPTLKADPPVLADKYAEWRDLLLKSRVSKSL